MECPFVFSSSAEIPVFCPREQCPLHVFSLEVVSPERTPAGISIAWRFSGNSTKVTVFPKNTWTTLLYLLFLSPSSVLFYVLLSFILFIYFSFILSQLLLLFFFLFLLLKEKKKKRFRADSHYTVHLRTAFVQKLFLHRNQ